VKCAAAPGSTTVSISSDKGLRQRVVARAAGKRAPIVASGGAAAYPTDGPLTMEQQIFKALDAGAGSIILLGATAFSLFLANSPMGQAYLSVWHQHVGIGALGLNLSIHEWVNEGLMALFFFHVGMEIKREFIFGSLASIKKAILPCIAALGGMIVPMGVYLGLNAAGRAGAVGAGWAIPMATDIAFAMGIYNFFKNRMPPGVAAFLLTLATVDDLGAIVVIAVCFAKGLVVPYIAGAVAFTAGLFAAMKANVTNMKVYAGLGAALWYCLLQGGINADVAGVVAALAIPAHALAPAGSNAPPEHEGGEATLLDHLIHVFTPWSAILIMPMFALANTCITLDASAIGSVITAPVSQGIIGGLMIGKPVGIAGLSMLAIKMGWASWPTGMNWKHLVTVGVLGGIGFTMSLFLIEMALVGQPEAAVSAKLAILVSSAAAAAIGAFMMTRFPVYVEKKDAVVNA